MPKFGSLKAQLEQGTIPTKKSQDLSTPTKIAEQTVNHVVSSPEYKGEEDFRTLSEPFRTLQRIDFILRHKNLTPTLKVATAILVQKFYDNNTHRKQVKMCELFPVSEGYTNRTRIDTLVQLERLGLIKRTIVHRQGQDITLLF